MYYTIYQITNKINNKIYIGKHQTKNLDDDYFGSGKILKNAVEKRGIENFEKEILHIFDTEEEMNQKEKEIVNEEFIKQEDTYNLCIGGGGGFSYINKNRIFSKNDIKLRSQNGKYSGNVHAKKMETDQKYRRKVVEGFMKIQHLSKGFLNKKHTEETKKKMSESAKGKQKGSKNSQYGTMWITNGEKSKKIKKFDSVPIGWRQGRI